MFSSKMLFVYFDSGTGITASGQEVSPDMTGTTVDTILPDSTPPRVVSLVINLSIGQLIFTFVVEILQDSVDFTMFSFLVCPMSHTP